MAETRRKFDADFREGEEGAAVVAVTLTGRPQLLAADPVSGPRTLRLAFHFGPDVQMKLDDGCALLAWPGAPVLI